MSYSFVLVSEKASSGGDGDNPENFDTLVGIAEGSLGLVSYAAREAKAPLTESGVDREWSVKLEDLNSGKTIVSLTADGDTVNTVVAARLRKLRKDAESPDATPAPQANPGE